MISVFSFEGSANCDGEPFYEGFAASMGNGMNVDVREVPGSPASDAVHGPTRIGRRRKT